MAGLFMDAYGLDSAFYSIGIIIVLSTIVSCWLIAHGEDRLET